MTPGLPALEVFVAVARHGSFRKAAAERGVSTSALSHVIRGLEQNLDIRLFHRTNRSIRITDAGAHLLARVSPALAELSAAIQQVDAFRDRPAGTLRLNVPRNAAELVIKPMLGRFISTYPEIRLEVITQDSFVDIVPEGFDAGVRAGQDLGQDMISVPLGPAHRFAVVGSPAYFAGRKVPLVPDDLRTHVCVARRYQNGGFYTWAFARDGETADLAIRGRLVVDDRSLIVEAALAGLGLAHIHETFVLDHVLRGDLIRVLEDWCPALPGFFLYYPGKRQVPVPLRAFIDMAAAERHVSSYANASCSSLPSKRPSFL